MNSCKIERTDFERVYDTYSDSLFRLALSHLKSSHDAEDVVQDVFMKFLENAENLKDDEHIKAWLIRVTINKSKDFLRKQKYRNHLSIDDVHHLEAPEKDDMPDVYQKILTLSDRYKDVIILHYFEDLSVEEIADVLGLSRSAVKMRLSRGREALKIILEKEEKL